MSLPAGPSQKLSRLVRVVCIGGGALGSLLSCRISLSGLAKCWILSSQTDRAAHLQKQGLRFLESHADLKTQLEEGRTVTFQATSKEQDILDNWQDEKTHESPYHVVFVAVKGHEATEHAAMRARKLLAHRSGVALTFQNGLGHFEILQKHCGSQAMVGTTSSGANFRDSSTLVHAGRGSTVIVENPTDHVAASTIEQLLNQAGIPTTTAAAGRRDEILFRKVMVNAAINPITALLRVQNGALLHSPDAIGMMKAITKEVVAVAHASGIKFQWNSANQKLSGDWKNLDEQIAFESVLQVARDTAMNTSSMFADVKRNRQTEIEAINGEIVRRGAKLGVPTPVNESVYRLVRALDAINMKNPQ